MTRSAPATDLRSAPRRRAPDAALVRSTAALVAAAAAMMATLLCVSPARAAGTAPATAAPAAASAASGSGTETGRPPVADLDAVRARLEAQLSGMTATSVDATPVPGLYEAVVDGHIYYVDESGEYLVDGSLVHLSTRENLTEKRLGTLHMATLATLAPEDMLTYEPEKPTGRSITVFTDISCGYCRKLHADIHTLLDAGIAVHYLLFPRAGLDSDGYRALESVWCADDPRAALTAAKTGASVPPRTCDNPIERHVAIAEQLGLRGTPLIYTDAGERIPGYREPAELVRMIRASTPWVAP